MLRYRDLEGKPGTFLAFFAKRLCRISVYGRAHLDVLNRPGPVLIVVNHTTIVDVIVIVGTLHNLGYTVDGPCVGECPHRRHLRPIGTQDVWNYRFARGICENSGIIPAEIGDGRSAYRAALQALRNGEAVLIYPEGDVTANEEGSPREWRPGAAALARVGNVTVLPIAHHDSRRLGQGGIKRSILLAFSRYITLRPRIRVRVGAPIGPDELGPLTHDQVKDLLEARLLHAWHEAATGVIEA